MSEGQGASAPSLAQKFASIIDPLKAKYDGRIAVFPVGRHGVFILRPQTGPEMRFVHKRLHEFQKEPVNQEGIDGLDADVLLMCAAHPLTKEECIAALDDFPTLHPKLHRALRRISGEGIEELDLGKD